MFTCVISCAVVKIPLIPPLPQFPITHLIAAMRFSAARNGLWLESRCETIKPVLVGDGLSGSFFQYNKRAEIICKPKSLDYWRLWRGGLDMASPAASFKSKVG